MKGQIPLLDLIKAMADKNSLDLFDNIAINDLESNELMEVLVLSKRQYFRIYDLRAAGLIERRKVRYGITSFGRIFLVSLKWLEKLVKGTGDYKQ